MSSDLEQSIFKTLAFFAAQDHAPTLLELHSLLVRTRPDQAPLELGALHDVLHGPLATRVRSQNGSYVMASQPEQPAPRSDAYIHSSRLFKKAGRWASRLRHVPFVRAAAISGSAAQMNAGTASDIDLLIIVAPERVFLARFLVSAYFQLFGGRRHGRHIRGRFCLNHYIIADAELPGDRNLYTAAEYASLLPVFGRAQVEHFWKINEPWIREFLLQPRLPVAHTFADNGPSPLQTVLEWLAQPAAGPLEALLGYLQKRRIRQSEFVVVSPLELSFHPDSKGQRVLSRYRAIIAALPPAPSGPA